MMFGFIAFVTCVVTVFAWFGAIVIRVGLEYGRKKIRPKLSGIERVILVLGSIGCLCVLYGWLIEPYWLSVEKVSLTTSRLKTGQTIRVVQISDLHCDPVVRLENRLPAAIAAEKPDIIVFTGDAINSAEGLPVFRTCLTRLARIAPTFVVKGNWDAWYFKDKDRFGGTGATELTDKAYKIHLKENDVWVGGLPVGTTNSVANVMKAVPPDDYKIFLFHYPDFIEEMEKNRIDLYLAGHTHGGQVALPLYGALITLSARGKQFESGLHRLGDTFEYTNRGIGMEGGKAPRVRFCARPELTVFDISGKSK